MNDIMKKKLIDMIKWCMTDLHTMPTKINDILNGAKLEGSVADGITGLIIPIAMTMLTLFFLIEFVNKCMNPDWITPQNIIFFIAKAMVFKSLLLKTTGMLDFIAQYATDIAESITVKSATTTVDLAPLIQQIEAIPSGFEGIMELLLYLIIVGLICLIVLASHLAIYVVIFSRIVELYILKAVAPVPFATLVSENFSSVGKRFIQTFFAVCLQGTIIMIASMVTAEVATVASGLGGGKFVGQLLVMLSITLCYVGVIMKSGSIARNVMGV